MLKLGDSSFSLLGDPWCRCRQFLAPQFWVSLWQYVELLVKLWF